MLTSAVGRTVNATPVLLRASGDTVSARLESRDQGKCLESHIENSAAMASRLDQITSGKVHRIETDELTPLEVAEQILSFSGWVGHLEGPYFAQ